MSDTKIENFFQKNINCFRSSNYWMRITRLKTTVLITAILLVLASIIVNQRANLLIYSMTSSELPELLEPKDEGEEVTQ